MGRSSWGRGTAACGIAIGVALALGACSSQAEPDVDPQDTLNIAQFEDYLSALFAGQEVWGEGLDEPITVGTVTGQFSASAGSTEGRGLQVYGDESYVQLQPNPTCDSLIAEEQSGR